MHKLLNRLSKAALIAGAIVSAACPAMAATQRESLRPLAEAIANVVKNDQTQTSIAMGSFPADGRLDNANAGPGVAEDLKSLLEELKVGVNPSSSLSLQGTIHKVPDPKDGKLVMIKIKATIVDGSANTIANLPLDIRDTALIGGILGVNSALPALATRETQRKAARGPQGAFLFSAGSADQEPAREPLWDRTARDVRRGRAERRRRLGESAGPACRQTARSPLCRDQHR